MNTSKKLEQNVCKDSQFQVTDLKSVLLDRQSGSSKVTNENTTKFWFESGEMTSKSRANLDLSLSGTNGINGGVSLFNIDPSSIDRGSPSKQILKVITIVFQGKTYEQNHIVFPDPQTKKANGSPRLQIGGISRCGEQITSIVGKKKSDKVGPLQQKIIIFTCAGTNTYVMEVVEHAPNIKKLEEVSRVVGNPKCGGRKFGII